MNWLPFISLRSHSLVSAAKDETIAVQRETIDGLNETLRAEREMRIATEKRVLELVEKSMTPAPEQRRRKHIGMEELPQQPETLDLSMIDPSDNQALALIAVREMTPGARTNASAMMRAVERIRQQVLEAHERKRVSLQTPGYVPTGVAAMIEDAERSGRAEAERVH